MIIRIELQEDELPTGERTQLIDLYEKSFPEEERRASEELFGDARPEGLKLYIIYEEEHKQMLGFVSLWVMEGFRFVEHFALFAEMRNKGYGAEVLRWLQSQSKEPIVLECERPHEEMARRRLAFYERCGFGIIDSNYEQAPYSSGQPWVPMLLLACQSLEAPQGIKRQIYKEVYALSYEEVERRVRD